VLPHELTPDRTLIPMRTVANTFNRITQFRHFLSQFPDLLLQGLSYISLEFSNIVFTQVHILLAVIRLQAFHLLAVLMLVHQPSAPAHECHYP
jgi:hypothetical protein